MNPLIKRLILDHGTVRVRMHANAGGLDAQEIPSRPRKPAVIRQGHGTDHVPARQSVDTAGQLRRPVLIPVQQKHLIRSLPGQQTGGGLGGSARAQQQAALAPDGDAGPVHGPFQTGGVGVVALVAALHPHQRIHRSDGPGVLVDLHQILHHPLLVWHRHIEAQQV